MFEQIIDRLMNLVWNTPEEMPLMVVILLLFGVFITIRLSFIQLTKLGHGLKVVRGAYDDPDDEGDINHFQALTTALSATVGIGNIAGVALAIHIGGPGAIFWMWVTAFFGMAIKFSEVTLAQKYRVTNEDGSVSGGPMYYIERGLGPNWKWLAVLFSVSAAICAFLTGNAVQANSVADIMAADFDIPRAFTGLLTAGLVGAVILGGIKRIGYVTARLVPIMALLYVLGGLIILLLHADQIIPSFALILANAFTPQAGALGVGSGVLILTLRYGVQRGIFSNEAGQGSAPIAHSAAKTDQPVREGVVALLEPFIDTIIVCSITALVIISTGAWDMHHKINISPDDPTIEYVIENLSTGNTVMGESLLFVDGVPVNGQMMRYSAPVDTMFVDPDEVLPFSGRVELTPEGPVAYADNGEIITTFTGGVVETATPLTARAFEIGLAPITGGGGIIVTIAVLLFAVSTSISWSYYGDRAAQYLFGFKSIFWYRLVYVGMHFVGAVTALTTIWAFGDVMLGFMAFFNIIGLIALSGVVVKLTKEYFQNTEI